MEIVGRETLIQALLGSPAMLFKLFYSPARSAQIRLMKFIELVKMPIIFKSLNEICKQNTTGGSRKFRKRGPSSPPPNENSTFQDMQHTALWAYRVCA